MERFITEGKPGVTQRRGAPYSTWFNGGIRTTAHFHNIIGILTETIGSPDPISIPFIADRQLGDSNLWWPIKPQAEWHMRQSIEYSMTANRAILDYASRYRETILYNIYRMGSDEIKWGSEDHWTFTPHEMARVQEGLVARALTPPARSPARRRRARRPAAAGAAAVAEAAAGGGDSPLYAGADGAGAARSARLLIPANQPDFGTATRFVNTLIKTGITIRARRRPSPSPASRIPRTSYVVTTASRSSRSSTSIRSWSASATGTSRCTGWPTSSPWSRTGTSWSGYWRSPRRPRRMPPTGW